MLDAPISESIQGMPLINALEPAASMVFASCTLLSQYQDL